MSRLDATSVEGIRRHRSSKGGRTRAPDQRRLTRRGRGGRQREAAQHGRHVVQLWRHGHIGGILPSCKHLQESLTPAINCTTVFRTLDGQALSCLCDGRLIRAVFIISAIIATVAAVGSVRSRAATAGSSCTTISTLMHCGLNHLPHRGSRFRCAQATPC